MRPRRAGAWLQPLLFADQEGEVPVPEELRGQVRTALAQILLSAVTDPSEDAGGEGDESQDPT